MSTRRPDVPAAGRARHWAVAGLLLAALLAGCAQPTPTPEPITIRCAFPQWDRAYYQGLIKSFGERYPSIVVEPRPLNGQALSQLKPGDADVLFTQSIRQQASRGDLLPLDPWLGHDDAFALGDLYPGAVDLFVSEGKTWGIPIWVDPLVMFYNKDLFDRAGVPYPQPGWTRDDFLEAALALRDKEAGVYGYAFGWPSADALLFAYAHGGRLVDDWRRPTTVTFDDPLAVEALDWFARLVTDYDVAPSPDQAGAAFGGDADWAAYHGAEGGKVAVWANGLSTRGGQGDEKWAFRWGVTTFPREGQMIAGVGIGALAISSQTEEPEACIKWIAFVSQQLPGEYAPARRSLAESKAYEQAVGSEIATVVQASMGGVLLTESELGGMGQALGLFFQAYQPVLEGQVTAFEAMAQAQQEAKKLIP